MQKEDTIYPTISIQGPMFSCIIDTKEDRDVETSNIPAFLLKTDDSSGITNLKFDGMMAELLVHIDPNLYRKYITIYEKGRKIMYAEFMKALY